MTGELPETLWRMHGLHSLFLEPKLDHLEELRLTGQLIDDLGEASGLPNLRFLSLNRNAVSGGLPGTFVWLYTTLLYTRNNPWAG